MALRGSHYYLIICLMLAGTASKLSLALNLPLNSDSALPGLLFFDMKENANYLLSGWYFPVNSYLFTDYPVHIILGSLMGMSVFTLKTGAFINFTAAALLSAWICGSVMKSRFAALVCLTAIFCLPASAAAPLLTPSSRSGTVLLSLMALALFMRITHSMGNEAPSDKGAGRSLASWISWIVMYAIASLALFSDMYFFLTFWMPLVFAVSAARVLGWKTAPHQSLTGLFVTGMLSVLTCILFFRLADVLDIRLMSHPNLAVLDFGGLLPRARIYMLSLFNPLMEGSGPVTMVLSLINILAFAMTVALMIRGVRNETSAGARAYLLFSAGLALSVGAPSLLKADSHFRYIAPAAFASGAMAAYAFHRDFPRRLIQRVLIVLCLLAACANIYGGLRYRAVQPGVTMVRFLQERGLEYGFAPYWDSNLITLLSGNRVRTRELKFLEKNALPGLWMSKHEWYRPGHYSGRTFLIMPPDTGEEYLETIEEIYGVPEGMYLVDRRMVLVWPYNIIRKRASVNLGDNGSILTGCSVTAGGRCYRESREGEKGFLSLSYPWMLKGGPYMAIFEIEAEAPQGESAGYVGVFGSEPGSPPLAIENIEEGRRVYRVQFSPREDGECSPHVYVNGNGSVRIFEIVLDHDI